MSHSDLLSLVDSQDFRKLFIEELGWLNPDIPNLVIRIEGTDYTLRQVAGYKGLRIWHHAGLPPHGIQRAIDTEVGRDSAERLIIFTGPDRQDWRWPRRAQLGSTNAKLVVHEHLVGVAQPDLVRRLLSIAIDLDVDLPLVELLQRMRLAFDTESETASIQAARLMSVLYGELAAAGVAPVEATLALARLLFLLFGDDTHMWQTEMFREYLANDTSATTLHHDLQALFNIVNQPEESRSDSIAESLVSFRYVNGGLYADPLDLPPLSEGFRDGLMAATEFDWGLISPAIFGSMFQTVKTKDARRSGGEHYTSEENILKTIGPLFLDEYKTRLEAAWDDKRKLIDLHNELGSLRILDPACGCGNFLIVAYRELRALELQLLMRRRDLDEMDGKLSPNTVILSQRSFDVTGDILVTLDHFFGIEVEEWPARIAETAMLLVDHLANQAMEEEFGFAPDRLPIRIAPTIKHANALKTEWADLVPVSDRTIILGNPPFSGQSTKTAQQTADTRAVWGQRYSGYLDYVTCWYAKAIDFYGPSNGRWAFVSTNSICQGEAAAELWQPILDAGWRCRFAHRSFEWTSEAVGQAAVHVSIVGFDRNKSLPKPRLWGYEPGGKGAGADRVVSRINPYLVEGPNLLIRSRQAALSPSLPAVGYGNKPTDGGNLTVKVRDHDEIIKDQTAARYLRPFIGSKELLHNKDRWCLWLVDATPEEIEGSPVLRARVERVRVARLASKKLATRRKAASPHLFDEARPSKVPYLGIPEVSSELRSYVPVRRFQPDVIVSNKVYVAPDPDNFVFGVVSSAMFMVWMKTIGGRLKSDVSFSNTYTYNNFPHPLVVPKVKQRIIGGAKRVLEARLEHQANSLADLYDPGAMPPDLLEAHRGLDAAVDSAFRWSGPDTEAARQKALFRAYATLTGQETLLP
jgi:hypothetical protein